MVYLAQYDYFLNDELLLYLLLLVKLHHGVFKLMGKKEESEIQRYRVGNRDVNR